MSIQGQLAQSAWSAQYQSVLSPIDWLSSAFSLNIGLLGNTAAQFRKTAFTAFSGNAVETYKYHLNPSQPNFRLAILKRRKFTQDGKDDRIAKSLAAVNAAQPTELTMPEWKMIVEEIEEDE